MVSNIFEVPVELWLPDSLADITIIYSGAEMITRISVSPDNSKYDSRGDCNAVIETETDTLVWECANTVIPDNVMEIGKRAFFQCEGLTNVISIPEGVATICEDAFASCKYLETVNLPDSLTGIGDFAFCDCFCIKDVVIPGNVTKIGVDAFGEITIKTVSTPKGIDISGTGLEYADKIIER